MIIPGINEPTYEKFLEKFSIVEFLTRLVQIDVADGNAVDHKTFMDLNKLNTITTQNRFELDLMVENPINLLETKLRNVDKVSFLVDVDTYVNAFIERAKKLGYMVGLSIRPTTQISRISDYIKDIDYVQFYGVKPGKSGSEFQISVLDKIEQFRAEYKSFPLQVDGGIDKDYLPLVLKAGADDVIMTSKIFEESDPKKALEQYVEISKRY
jgi:ribulose-phosphate 3-epimerase